MPHVVRQLTHFGACDGRDILAPLYTPDDLRSERQANSLK